MSVAGKQRNDIKKQFELACNIFVNTHPDAHLEGMMAVIHSYRDFMKKNVEQAGPLDGSTFVSWMESAERRPEDFPEPWGAALIEYFDSLVIEAVRKENAQPATVVQALDEWANESTAEIERHRDIPEGFFDV